MPRQRRHTPAGMVFHVINRGVGRQALFHKGEDYAAFERVMAEAWQRVPIRILAYTLMPNHWHFVFCDLVHSRGRSILSGIARFHR